MTATETEVPSTEQVLVEMLTENTGAHFLDSGGAYGRNWERNQGINFDERPAFRVEANARWNELSVTMDVYHFLVEAVEFDPEMDALFTEFAELPENSEKHWLELMEEFPSWVVDECQDFCEENFLGNKPAFATTNTYNGEDALSQTLQYTSFGFNGDPFEEYVLLQIHGGCDVRGGYTRPRVFRSDSNGGVCLYDNARFVASSARQNDETNIPLPGLATDDVTHIYWTTWDGGYTYDRGEGDVYPVPFDIRPLSEFEMVEVDSEAEIVQGVICVLDGVPYCPYFGTPLSFFHF